MAGDLFTWLDAIWNKTCPEGTPPTFIMHRFLASDMRLANAARVLQVEVREPKLVFRVWQGLLPRGSGAPRLTYVVPKKPPPAEELAARMMKVLGENRVVVEEMLELAELAGVQRDFYVYFGIEPPDDAPIELQERTGSGGLLEGI